MPCVSDKTRTCLQIHDCGLAGYSEVLRRQHQLHKQVCDGRMPDTVLIAEHHPVITFGVRQSANRLRINRNSLAQENIDVVQTRRGGGATAHNPGQLVFYPILNLRQMGLGISEYVRKLETIGIELLEQLGLNSQRQRGLPGLWIADRKIASVGVRVSKAVTYHGMAINIRNDLSIFDFLVPCGLDGVEMTSVLKETSRRHSMSGVKQILIELLNEHFSTSSELRKLPVWLKRTFSSGQDYNRTSSLIDSLGIRTICTIANCPNRSLCWSKGAATVLILGDLCTRSCGFCSVPAGKPAPPDPNEPARVAKMAEKLGLKYLVITSVNRDDLPDGGASHFRDCINSVRSICPDMKFEILTPDFRNCQAEAIRILSDALPFVFAHNVETVPSLYPLARAGGDYQLSLNLLKTAKDICEGIQTKSSIMLGLGETAGEIEQVLKDLRSVGCDRITIGQYLKPSKDSLEVVEYITPQRFDFWRQKALGLGFSWVCSEPFARSSYLAGQESILEYGFL